MNYIFDVDGTLSFDGETIAKPITDAIRELMAAGNEIVFASARPIRDLLPIIPDFQTQRLIGANGAMISVDQRIQVISQIEADDYMYLKSLIKKFDLDYVIDSSWNYATHLTQPSFIEKMIDPGNLAKQVLVSEISEPIKTIFVNVEDDLQTKLLSIIKQETSLNAIGLSGEHTVDVTAQTINKFSTVKKLDISDYVAFGNDRNDFELLNQAKSSIWVASKPNLSAYGEQFDSICRPNPESVATMIRSFI